MTEYRMQISEYRKSTQNSEICILYSVIFAVAVPSNTPACA